MAAGVHVAQHHRRGGHHQRLLLVALRQGALNPPNTVLPPELSRGSDSVAIMARSTERRTCFARTL